MTEDNQSGDTNSTSPYGFVSSTIDGNTAENGTQATFTIRLKSQPIGSVLIGLSSDDESEGFVEPVALNFDADNWDTDQVVTVTGVDDDIQDSDVEYSIVFMQADSTDDSYSGLKPDDVSVINEDNDTPTIDSNDITLFNFLTTDNTDISADSMGIIDESLNTINVIVPSGTNVSKLKAKFNTNGFTVTVGGKEQISHQTANDFTDTLTYLVTAENGNQKFYTVTIKEDPYPANSILDFRFETDTNPGFTANVSGIINQVGKTILLNVPYGSERSDLVASFSTNWGSLKTAETNQISGITGNDFTAPVTYTVGSIPSLVDYTVTVGVAAFDAKEITAFSFETRKNPNLSEEVIGIISDSTIAVEVPFGTDVTALVATFSASGSSVDVGSVLQSSGLTPNDFNDVVTYSVTAEDGSTLDYNINVSFDDTSKSITAFSFLASDNNSLDSDVIGTISATEIKVVFPYVFDLSQELKATFSTTGASVTVEGKKQTSGGTFNNFDMPVIYTVEAEDGTTKNYTVMVTVPNAKSIDSFAFLASNNPSQLSGDINADISDTDILVDVPYGTDVNDLVATFATSGSSVKVESDNQVSGTTSNNFTDPVIYTVVATDMSEAYYTITVNIAAGSDTKEITAFSLGGFAGTIFKTDISVDVPYGTDVTALIATFSTTGSSVMVESVNQDSGTTHNDFTDPIIYTVIAEDGSEAYYTITVNIAADDAKEITTFSLAGFAGTIFKTDISVDVPFGTDVTDLIATFSTFGSSVKVGSDNQVSGTTSNNFTEPVIYTVVAADTTELDYTITVNIAAASDTNEMTAFSLGGFEGTIFKTDVSLNVPFGTDVTALVADFSTTGWIVNIGSVEQVSGTTTNNFTDPVIYTVIAEDESEQDYTVTVNVALNDAKEITAFNLDGVDGTFSGTNISVDFPYGTDVTALVAGFSTTGWIVNIGSVEQLSGITTNNFTDPVIYTVIAEDESEQDYTVTVNVALNDAKEITAFSLDGVEGTISGTDINITMPYGFDLSNKLAAVFTTTGDLVMVGTKTQTSGNSLNKFDVPVTYTVEAQDGTTQDYVVTVEVSTVVNISIDSFGFLAGSNSELSQDAMATISGTEITVSVPNGTDITALQASFAFTGDEVQIGGKTQTSDKTKQDFSSPIVYSVVAGDGTTSRDYTVTVTIEP